LVDFCACLDDRICKLHITAEPVAQESNR
jgi:hypothetical protein